MQAHLDAELSGFIDWGWAKALPNQQHLKLGRKEPGFQDAQVAFLPVEQRDFRGLHHVRSLIALCGLHELAESLLVERCDRTFFAILQREVGLQLSETSIAEGDEPNF